MDTSRKSTTPADLTACRYRSPDVAPNISARYYGARCRNVVATRQHFVRGGDSIARARHPGPFARITHARLRAAQTTDGPTGSFSCLLVRLVVSGTATHAGRRPHRRGCGSRTPPQDASRTPRLPALRRW